MDSVFGLVGDGFAIIAADAVAGRSILVFKHDQDKIAQLDSHKMMGLAGVGADGVNFSEYIQKNMKLYELNHDMKLTTHAAANYIRGQLAIALRRGPYQTNPLIAGYDEGKGASMYFCDYMGTLQKVQFGAHGYAGNFLYALFDRQWREGLTLDEALIIIKNCVQELHTRFLIAQPKFVVKVVDAEGIRTIEL